MRVTPQSMMALAVLALSAAPGWAGERLDKTTRDILIPHKAIYDIEMTSKRSSSQVLNIHGQMYFALQPTCDAWSTDHRFNLYYEYTDSPPMQITSDFTTYEPYDGKSFDFSSRRKRDGEMYQELRGTATIENGKDGNVAYAAPAGLNIPVPSGGMFPMAHTMQMMKNVRDGRKVFNAVVFDGSDEEGPIEINTIVGKSVAPDHIIKAGPAIEASLIQSPARKVRMAFFPLASDNPGSDYEMDVVLHDNGVISDMDVEYGEFSVSQKLIALEKIDSPVCPETAPAKAEGGKDKAPKKKLFGIIP